MLRIVSYYTPSHKEMCQRFVMSRAYDFHERRFSAFEQTCPTGEFKSSGWNDCMLDKLRCLLSLPCDGMPTLYVDADVALMPGLHDWLSSYVDQLDQADIAFSDDVVQWCAGIMVFRSVSPVLEFFRTVAHMSGVLNLPDQDVIHHLRAWAQSTGGVLPIRPRLLPREVFCNWATVNAPTVPAPWDGQGFVLPATCLAWHANWTIGIDNKMRMLDRVVMRETSPHVVGNA
jgi:hypothetical protein